MNPEHTQLKDGRGRLRLLGVTFGLAATLAVCDLALKAREAAETAVGEPRSIARFRLETRGGRLCQRETGRLFSGWLTDHARDGRLRLRTGVVAGRLHGVSEGWGTNGVMELREFFEWGVPSGLRVTWHGNGRLASEGRLINGRQEGLYRRWYEDGRPEASAEFRAGKPHGFSCAWYTSGNLKAEAWMNRGEVVSRHFYADG